MDTLLAICLGIGLAAACGFRVFVPLLGLSIAALSGYLELNDSFAWAGTWPALACFLTATLLEIAAYYIPWVDNLLDSIATPAAVAAGTVVTASVMTDVPPLVRWSVALIAGGGVAGIVQSATVAVRGASSVTTAGTGNWLVASIELVAALAATAFSLLLPVLGAILAAVLILAACYLWPRRRSSALPEASPEPDR